MVIPDTIPKIPSLIRPPLFLPKEFSIICLIQQLKMIKSTSRIYQVKEKIRINSNRIQAHVDKIDEFKIIIHKHEVRNVQHEDLGDRIEIHYIKNGMKQETIGMYSQFQSKMVCPFTIHFVMSLELP